MPGLRTLPLPRVKALALNSPTGGSSPQKSRPSSPAGNSSSRSLFLQKPRASTPAGSHSPGKRAQGARATPLATLSPSDLASLVSGSETVGNSPSADSSVGAVDRRGQPRAFERAKQAEEKLQQKKDLQVAAEWNECFKSAANRRDPEKLAEFWTELKGRLIKKFGTLTAAFAFLRAGGEESMNFLSFSDMLRMVYLPLDQRISRLLFEIASGGDHKLWLQDLRLALMERNVQRLRMALVLHHEKKERINFHVQSFLGRLMQANEKVSDQSVDRFQRKLTVPLCRQIWKGLMDRLGASGKRDVSVSRQLFERMVRDDIAGKFFQNYEVAFMMRIFDRVDTNAGYKSATHSVSLLSLLCALLLFSPEADRCLKVALLFEAYDADEDGCLLYGQILALFQGICTMKPLADENTRGAKDFTFQEELAMQEGTRFYERTRWFLQRECHVEGDVVALRELWEALERQQALLEAILPSMVKMRWVAKPSQQERGTSPYNEDDVAADVGRRLSSASIDPLTNLTRPRRMSIRGVPKPFLANSSGVPQPGGRYQAALQQAIPVAIAKHHERKGLESVPILSSFESPAAGHRQSVSFRAPQELVEEPPPIPMESPASLRQAGTFKESLTANFKQSLRALSDQRMHDLNESFNQRVDLDGEVRAVSSVGRSRTPQVPLRNRPGLVMSEPSRPGSAASLPDPKRSMSRSTSAPAGDLSTGLAAEMTRGVNVPSINCERWGVASTERFRLVSTLRTTFGRVQVAQDRQAPPEPETGIGFQCFLCQSFHTLSAGCCT